MPDTDQPPAVPHLRTVAMPRDANPSGDIFGGWTLSQMDIAGATFAAERSGGRVATVAIDAMKFLAPIRVGDEVSCYCHEASHSEHAVGVRVETWTRSRQGQAPAKVTEGLFTYAAITDDGHKRPVED
jgi:acyl-CoA thioesterase YciA